MNSNKIVNLTTPTAEADAANKSYVDGAIPIRGIIMWSGTTTPPNWALCNGQNGTPDLRGRFVLGSGAGTGLTSRSLSQTGGAETVTLTEAQMPTHSHDVSGNYTTTDNGLHSHTVNSLVHSYYQSGYDGQYSGYNGFASVSTTQAGTHNHTVRISETPKGSSNAHENMPPFYVLAFIMRIS